MSFRYFLLLLTILYNIKSLSFSQYTDSPKLETIVIEIKKTKKRNLIDVTGDNYFTIWHAVNNKHVLGQRYSLPQYHSSHQHLSLLGFR